MAYEPPIKLIQMDDSIETMIQRAARLETEKFDGYVMECVHHVGVDINRTALIAAIEGDRKRYEQAYQEGLYDGMKRERIVHWIEKFTGNEYVVICSCCSNETNEIADYHFEYNYCPHCGARMKPEEE